MSENTTLDKLLEKISKLSNSGVNSEAVAELKALAATLTEELSSSEDEAPQS